MTAGSLPGLGRPTLALAIAVAVSMPLLLGACGGASAPLSAPGAGVGVGEAPLPPLPSLPPVIRCAPASGDTLAKAAACQPAVEAAQHS